MITIDMDMAKNITKERLRQERVPKFEELDIQFQRAQEEGERPGQDVLPR